MREYSFELDIKDLKSLSKRIFKDVDLLSNGISLDLITIVFKKNVMVVWDYSLEGKCNEGNFMMPKSESEFLKKLMHHCGRQKIESQLKNNIEITA